jgi:RecB family exonuclease
MLHESPRSTAHPPHGDADACILLRALADATRLHPYERKILVCETRAQGRELLGALSRSGCRWVGWEVATIASLAARLSGDRLAAAGIRLADEPATVALVDAALDTAISLGEAGPLAAVSDLPGYRAALYATVRTLREAGVGRGALEGGAADSPKIRAIAAVLRRYEDALRTDAMVDAAGTVRVACDALDAGEASLPGRTYLLPWLPAGGGAGNLVRLMREVAGAEVLAADPVLGLSPPRGILGIPPTPPASPLSRLHAPEGGSPVPIDLFVAATPADELREVLRRVAAEEIPWDQVEIVAAAPGGYPEALDALCSRLGIPASYSAGLDARRTRVGRAIESYLGWMEEGFPADFLRRLLQTGDLSPPGAPGSGPSLARRLRALAIGWGRDAYLPALDRALAGLGREEGRREDEDPEEYSERADRERTELETLRALLAALIASTPPLPGRGSAEAVTITPAAVAAGVLAFLEFVPADAADERAVREEATRRLARVRATLTREMEWRAAISVARRFLRLRVAPADGEGVAPRGSAGGRLLLSDLRSGGLSGRACTFVVGLEASAVHRGGVDPLLPDADRLRIREAAGPEVGAALPTVAESGEERRWVLAALLARLRGRVTLSYPLGDGSDGPAGAPAAELLQALRLRKGDPTLSYDALREALGPVRGAVPIEDEGAVARLDESDAWLDLLAPGGVAREGRSIVREAFPGLDAGLAALAAREGAAPSAYEGAVETGTTSLSGTLSPSRLETLGTCPRRYFLRHVLGIRPLEDPEWDVTRWLDPLRRGSLLHRVYEESLRHARADEIPLADPGFADLAHRLLEEECARLAETVPAPSATLREREIARLRLDIDSFIRMIGDAPPDWIDLEFDFGGEDRPMVLRTRHGDVRLRGIIDRVDRLRDGSLRVVDYKSGSTWGYRSREPFRGGRRSQHLAYLAAAEAHFGAPAHTMEYHFPTVRGENTVVRYDSDALRDGERVLDALVELAIRGPFVATDDAGDCRFCDFRDVCRVTDGGYGKSACEDVTLSLERLEAGEEGVQLLAVLRGAR